LETGWAGPVYLLDLTAFRVGPERGEVQQVDRPGGDLLGELLVHLRGDQRPAQQLRLAVQGPDPVARGRR
jgi:hypothetical protein